MALPTCAELEAARLVGDHEADAVIAALGKDVWVVNAALRHVHENGAPLPPAVPETVRRFFDEHVAVPSWLDLASVHRAQRWASRHIFQLTTALFCASLPTAYAAARGARVLAATDRMRGAELDKRVNETAQFVLEVVAEGGFSPTGSAVRAIQKVRLVHAAVRAHLIERGWNDEVPINQEDLVGTLFTFSVVVIRAMRRLGVPIDERTADDYYQLWRGVGAMLGIRDELLVPDYASAEIVGERVAGRHFASSEHGRALMASLLEGIERHVPILPSAPRALVRYLVGDRIADQLGVPMGETLRASRAVARLLPRWRTGVTASIAPQLSSWLGRPLLQVVVATKLRGEAASFAMPTS